MVVFLQERMFAAMLYATGPMIQHANAAQRPWWDRPAPRNWPDYWESPEEQQNRRHLMGHDAVEFQNLKTYYATMTYKNGDIYKGDWKNGNMDGYGTMTWKDKSEYVGYWKEGKRQGKGTKTWDNGNFKYDGEWNDDKMHGEGILIGKNGDVFKGQWKNGMQDQGMMKWKNGNVYDGTFKNGSRNVGELKTETGKLIARYVNGIKLRSED